MSAAKHTPGPLHVRTTSIDVVLQGVTHILCDTNEIPVAFCPSWRNDPEDAAEAAANLRLFAAAPDMLEALKSILTANVDGKNVERYLDAIDIARAAIAKAEGRSDG